MNRLFLVHRSPSQGLSRACSLVCVYFFLFFHWKVPRGCFRDRSRLPFRSWLAFETTRRRCDRFWREIASYFLMASRECVARITAINLAEYDFIELEWGFAKVINGQSVVLHQRCSKNSWNSKTMTAPLKLIIIYQLMYSFMQKVIE